MSFILLGILNSQAAGAGGAGAYDLLETTVLTSSASSVSFTGLDSYTDYKHLQIRMTAQSDRASTSDTIELTFNSDTSSSYRSHHLRGNGSSVASFEINSTPMQLPVNMPGASSNTDGFGAGILDILDFSSSNKNTTVRALSGYAIAANYIALGSGGYFNTNAVTDIAFALVAGNNFGTGSRFSLYGIKG